MANVVFITGASTGFGKDAAERFARRGHHVFATMRDIGGRNAESRQALERLAASEQLRLEVLELDVTDERSVSRAAQQALDRAGRLDVVINNAGIAGIGVTEAYTPEQFDRIYQVNVFGVLRVNRAVLPAMRRQGSGLLIHVSSAAGRCTIPGMAAYCSSKYALEAIADAYRFELRQFGIDSVLVEPGIYRTPIFDRVVPADDSARVADYGAKADFADRVFGVFKAAISAPDAPGSEEVGEVLVKLADTPFGQRPFRTPVGAMIHELLDGYNAASAALRPVVANVFNVADLADGPVPAGV
jgi:NAD(P)-dependent dehydrogenase (short-subunit alcohol dehydrogenase family)